MYNRRNYGKRKNLRYKRNYKRKNNRKDKYTLRIVKRELHRQIENKQATKVISGARVSTAMPTSIATGMFSIIPNLAQGTSAQGQRIGRVVRPLSLRLTINAFTNSLNEEPTCPIYFDVYVFSCKKFKDQSLYDTLGVAEISQFFRPTALSGGTDTFYQGVVQNYHQNVNREVINLYAKKRFLMSPIGTGTQTPNQDPRWIENRSSRQFEMNIPLTKHCAKVLRYTNAIDETPNNCALFACVVATTAVAGINPPASTETYGACSFISTLVYEDA